MMKKHFTNKLLLAIALLFGIVFYSCTDEINMVDPESNSREQFLGTWTVYESCIRLNYEVEIVADSTVDTKVFIYNFAFMGQEFDPAYGLVSGNKVNLPHKPSAMAGRLMVQVLYKATVQLFGCITSKSAPMAQTARRIMRNSIMPGFCQRHLFEKIPDQRKGIETLKPVKKFPIFLFIKRKGPPSLPSSGFASRGFAKGISLRKARRQKGMETVKNLVVNFRYSYS